MDGFKLRSPGRGKIFNISRKMSNGPSQKNDLAFGEASEMSNLDILQMYLNTTLERKGGYAVFDFENPTKTIFVELKSRRIKHDTYDTAIIGLNKIAFCEELCDVQYWFAFCYLDGIYVIKYDSELFADFEVRKDYIRGPRNDVENKPQTVVMIPIKHLTKVNVEDLKAPTVIPEVVEVVEKAENTVIDPSS